MLANPGAVCFWQPIPSGLNLVIAAVLCDSLLYVVYIYTVCKVERFVLTINKRKLLLSNKRCGTTQKRRLQFAPNNKNMGILHSS